MPKRQYNIYIQDAFIALENNLKKSIFCNLSSKKHLEGVIKLLNMPCRMSIRSKSEKLFIKFT